MSNTKGSTVLLSLLFIGILAFPVLAAVPNQINYQGRLTDDIGALVPDGTYTITYAIYDEYLEVLKEEEEYQEQRRIS